MADTPYPDRMSEHVSTTLRRLLDDEHLTTRAELADRLGLTKSGLQQLLVGRAAWKTSRIVALEDVLGVRLFTPRGVSVTRTVTGGYQHSPGRAA
jgi:hypothetical protein